MTIWLCYIGAGLVAGTFGATFGVGGGILMVSMLGVAFGYSQKSAQATSLAVMIPMALISTLRYKYGLKIEMPTVPLLVLAASACIGALVGVEIAGWLSGTMLRRLFAVVLVAVAIKLMLTPDTPRKAEPPVPQPAATSAPAP